MSPALCTAVGIDQARAFALCGGDDYELVLTIAPAHLPAAMAAAQRVDVPLTVIGTVAEGAGLRCLDGAGRDVTPLTRGYRHFV